MCDNVNWLSCIRNFPDTNSRSPATSIASLCVLAASILPCQAGSADLWLHCEEQRLPAGRDFKKWKVPLWDDELEKGSSSEWEGAVSRKGTRKAPTPPHKKCFHLVRRGLRKKCPLGRCSTGVCMLERRIWAGFQCSHPNPTPAPRLVLCAVHKLHNCSGGLSNPDYTPQG